MKMKQKRETKSIKQTITSYVTPFHATRSGAPFLTLSIVHVYYVLGTNMAKALKSLVLHHHGYFHGITYFA